MDGFWNDVRQSARALAARPAFTAVAVLTLSLGIGATTAMFSAVNSVLLRPLDYADVDRVVTMVQLDTQDGERAEGVSAANVRDLAAASELLSVAAVADPWSHDLLENGRAVSLRSWAVSEGFFEAIGGAPLLGRVFTPDEYLPGAEPVVVLGHGTWVNRFGADPSVVGSTVVLDGGPRTVVGVLRRGFKFPSAAEMWSPRPHQPWDANSRAAAYMEGVARLGPGVTLAQAQAEADRIAASLAEQYPRTNTNVAFRLVPLREHLFGDVRSPLWVLFGAVALVLLIAAANVAGLQLARGAGRAREYALRGALGAGGGRLLRLVSTESLMIAGAGCALGIGLAYAGVGVIRAIAPDHLPRIDELALDRGVLLFGVLASALSAFGSGIAPALAAARTDPQIALSDGARGTTGGRRTHRLRNQLVVGEIALALVLAIGAGLLVRSFDALLSSELGFDPQGRLAVQVFAYGEEGPDVDFLQVSLEQIRAVPGVAAVGVTTDLPSADDRSVSSIEINVPFTVDDRATPSVGEEPVVAISSISPEYPEVMGIPLTRGRTFSVLDHQESAPVVMINEALARRHFPDQDPVGEKLTIRFSPVVSREIVGVLADVRPRGHESEPRPEAYFPLAQMPSGSLTFVVRSRVDPATLILSVQEAIWSVDPEQAVWAARTLPDLLWDWVKQRSFNTALLTAFAGLALALAAVGVYALMSFTVEQRMNELGIRRAMGAGSGSILRAVLGRGAVLTLLGVGLGLAGSVALSLFLRGMLYSVGPFDLPTFAGLAAAVTLVALVSASLPARRATRVDPSVALLAD
jgi:putative ABC transport system permease protein